MKAMSDINWGFPTPEDEARMKQEREQERERKEKLQKEKNEREYAWLEPVVWNWDCPNCKQLNVETDFLSVVTCTKCSNEYNAGSLDDW